MNAAIIQFPTHKDIVRVEGVEGAGECWAIVHQRHGQRAYQITTRQDFWRAHDVAREVATQLGAEYVGPPEPPGAA